MDVENSLLEIALRDLQTSMLILGTTNDEIMQNMVAYHTQQALEKIIKHLIVQCRGFGNNDHDIGRLLADANECGISLPDWVRENAYTISQWATNIRYNSKFKTNRDEILMYNQSISQWIKDLGIN